MSSYAFLPEVRRAIRRADDAELAAERLADILAKALESLAQYDLAEAQGLRGRAIAITRGVMPNAARRLTRIPLSGPQERPDEQE